MEAHMFQNNDEIIISVTANEPSFITISDLMKELSVLDPAIWTEKTIGYEVRK